jgi:hypothetical protein
MKTLEKYVEDIFSEVVDCNEKREVVEEITLNLKEKIADMMKEGKSEEDAINKAIVDFGDIGEIKKELIQKQSGEKRKQAALRLGYSIWGTALLIGLFCFINFYFSPWVIWCVFPIFGVLWWPLTMLFVWLKHR